MFKINNKPSLYKFLQENINEKDNKDIFKASIALMKKEKIFRNTEKLEKYLKENTNFKTNSASFLFNLSSNIFEFSRRV